jgi:AcrR family transcriptional regulator
MGPEERYAQILAHASRLFSRRSYAAVSLEDIASAAGVTRGLLHHYFGTKRELYLTVVRHITRLPPWVDDGTGLSDTQALVARYVDLFLDSAERNKLAWLAVTGGTGIGRDRALEKILHEIEEAYVDRVVEIFGGDPAATSQAERAVLRCYGSFAQAVSREWLSHRRFSRDQAHTLLVHTLMTLSSDLLEGRLDLESAPPPQRRLGRRDVPAPSGRRPRPRVRRSGGAVA